MIKIPLHSQKVKNYKRLELIYINPYYILDSMHNSWIQIIIDIIVVWGMGCGSLARVTTL